MATPRRRPGAGSFAVAVEGRPPVLDLAAVAGFAYVGLIATALAFTAWFTGLRQLPAATVGLIGLLNPVTGVLLGTTLSGELLTLPQLLGLALVLGGITLARPRRETPIAPAVTDPPKVYR
ncbi:EamA family transporter [Kribbella turkmenica]|uniref:EamA family transporter n=1 Tax=Kribbella turkmenica TaxID=2530375 RepID=UPI00192E0C9F|nr:EamA family transporter [Kribbella turkmenica]